MKRLAKDAGIEDPTDEELRNFDRHRPNKKVSNEEWQSGTDQDSRIAKMKDGTTHLAYKAEHVVDLDSNLILAAEIYHADEGDPATLLPSVATAQLNLLRAGSKTEIANVAADKGYHKAETLADCDEAGWRTYIPETKRHARHRWADKPPEHEAAFRANRRRVRGARSKRLQRKRSEYVERTFAHLCETGGARRSWLCGLEKVSKRYLMQAAAHNLGLMMRKLFGMGTPRGLQSPRSGLALWFWMLLRLSLIRVAEQWRRGKLRRPHSRSDDLHYAA